MHYNCTWEDTVVNSWLNKASFVDVVIVAFCSLKVRKARHSRGSSGAWSLYGLREDFNASLRTIHPAAVRDILHLKLRTKVDPADSECFWPEQTLFLGDLYRKKVFFERRISSISSLNCQYIYKYIWVFSVIKSARPPLPTVDFVSVLGEISFTSLSHIIYVVSRQNFSSLCFCT